MCLYFLIILAKLTISIIEGVEYQRERNGNEHLGRCKDSCRCVCDCVRHSRRLGVGQGARAQKGARRSQEHAAQCQEWRAGRRRESLR